MRGIGGGTRGEAKGEGREGGGGEERQEEGRGERDTNGGRKEINCSIEFSAKSEVTERWRQMIN